MVLSKYWKNEKAFANYIFYRLLCFIIYFISWIYFLYASCNNNYYILAGVEKEEDRKRYTIMVYTGTKRDSETKASPK